MIHVASAQLARRESTRAPPESEPSQLTSRSVNRAAKKRRVKYCSKCHWPQWLVWHHRSAALDADPDSNPEQKYICEASTFHIAPRIHVRAAKRVPIPRLEIEAALEKVRTSTLRPLLVNILKVSGHQSCIQYFAFLHRVV